MIAGKFAEAFPKNERNAKDEKRQIMEVLLGVSTRSAPGENEKKKKKSDGKDGSRSRVRRKEKKSCRHAQSQPATES